MHWCTHTDSCVLNEDRTKGQRLVFGYLRTRCQMELCLRGHSDMGFILYNITKNKNKNKKIIIQNITDVDMYKA